MFLAAAPERKRVIKDQLTTAGAASWEFLLYDLKVIQPEREMMLKVLGQLLLFKQDGTFGCSDLLKLRQ